MKSRGSIALFVTATLLGLVFGNAMGSLMEEFFGITGTAASVLAALLVGAIAAGSAWLVLTRMEAAPATKPADTLIQDPPVARFLFQDPRAALLWLPLRLFVGWEWLEAGLHKFQDPAWMNSSTAIRGYWERAVAIPEQGRPAITFDWWRDFLEMLLANNVDVWFSKVIVFGELAVGLGLIVGALVGVAAFGGMLMNLSFLLSGSSSTNPVLLTLAFGIVLAWKVAGHIGLDRVLLPALGTPWQRGTLLAQKSAPAAPPA